MLPIEFEDGYELNCEPRREDPLYYYKKKGSWDNVIGFQVDPLYKEYSEMTVTIKVFEDHIARYNAMPNIDQEKILRRVLESMIKYFKHWKTIKLEGILYATINQTDTFPDQIEDFGMERTSDCIKFSRF